MTVDALVRRAVRPASARSSRSSFGRSGRRRPAAGGYTPGTYKPSADDFASFALATAKRYSGTFEGCPRVRYCQAWNEPNLTLDLNTQLVDGKPVSPGWYRDMVNAFAGAAHSVHRDNVVVAGGLAPFFDNSPEITRQNPDWGLLTFMRNLLCVSKDLKSTCNARVDFDVWSTHPYVSRHTTRSRRTTCRSETFPEMRAVLDTAIRAGHIVWAHRPQFWVTEFS
jgi:hypothetical protein